MLSNVTGEQRRALFALSNLGYADRDRVARVIGVAVDLASLAARRAARLPHRGRPVPGPRPVDRSARCACCPRTRSPTCGRGSSTSSSRAAISLGPAPSPWRTTTSTRWRGSQPEVVRRNVAALPIDMVRPWSDVLQRARPDAPETQLLRAALRQALDFTDRRADVDADEAAAGFPQSRRPRRRDRGGRRRHGRLVHARRRHETPRPGSPSRHHSRLTRAPRRSMSHCAPSPPSAPR